MFCKFMVDYWNYEICQKTLGYVAKVMKIPPVLFENNDHHLNPWDGTTKYSAFGVYKSIRVIINDGSRCFEFDTMAHLDSPFSK